MGALAAVQFIRAAASLKADWPALNQVRNQRLSRVAIIVGLFIVSAGGLVYCACFPIESAGQYYQLGGVSLCLIASALGFELGKVMFSNFLAGFLGDVQIYCTRDQNADFFALRTQILQLVESVILHTIRRRYQRVHILAHSLSSTIAMDALMRIYEAKQEGTVLDHQWQRIRGFLSFGTSLEKMKFFFNVMNPGRSASYDQWRGDFYGSMFTTEKAALYAVNSANRGIYWANYWYFFDFISDRITTYTSFLRPLDGGPRSAKRARAVIKARLSQGKEALPKPVARNRVSLRFPPPRTRFILHGEYLDSDWFWKAAPTIPNALLPLPDFEEYRADNVSSIGAIEILTSRNDPQRHFAELSWNPLDRVDIADADAHLRSGSDFIR